MAIYLGENKLTGTGVQVDDALSSTSTNPVENKAVTEALTDVGYSEWQKPADWIDIRSGALPNSVYFLIGHSADYTQFPKLSVRANIANSGSYDIYIDGIKYATSAYNATTDIDWETLALTTGKATTFPIELVTHIVRITPTLSTNTISYVTVRKHSQATSGMAQLGVLWAHYNINNTIEMNATLCTYDTSYQPYLVAVTATNDLIKTTGTLVGIWNSGGDHTTYCSGYIAHLPTFEGQDATQAVNCARLGPTDTNVKKLVLSGDNKYTIGNYAFTSSQKLKEIVCNNLAISGNARAAFSNNYALKKLPSIDYTAATDMQNFLTNASSLEPTMLDLSAGTGITRLGIFGTSTNRIDGLKGLTVSNQAPFSNTNSPQLNVSYTGLDRAALVNLFKSMPYNVGYTVTGSPTITDGVVSGFSTSNYLLLSNYFLLNNAWEIQTKIHTNLNNQQQIIFCAGAGRNSDTRYGYQLYIYTNNSLGFNTSSDGSSWDILSQSNPTLNNNTDYYIKAGWDKNKYYIDISTDGVSYTNYASVVSSNPVYQNGTRYTLGIWEAQPTVYFTGSIDLNNTYININGVPWFTGTAAMTKTCSVVGCTGTADLTQDDKNIALNKGWALTVA